MTVGNITFQSSIDLLNKGFAWAKEQALFYVHDDENGAGKWYEAALPGRDSFCMRDVSHQAEGAGALGLCEHTKNMLYLFAKSISREKDYCGYWEINQDGVPCPEDYISDEDFWYNLPGSFEVIRACYMQYLWTGDEDYLKDPVFLNFYRQTCEEFVQQWDVDGDGVLEHYPHQGRRGIATYNETDIGVRTGADMLASQYAAYGCYARMLRITGKDEEAEKYERKAEELKCQYLTKWRRGNGKGFYGAVLVNGEFMEEYDQEGNFLPIRFGILDGEPGLFEVIDEVAENGPSNVEGRSYFPQLFYRCGRREEGLFFLLSLCDEKLDRREYPEVSYSLVATVVNWLMGIDRKETGEIVTCSSLPEEENARICRMPVGKTEICVEHRGNRETAFTNLGPVSVEWKACFLGEHKEAVCGTQAVALCQEENAAGETFSYAILSVKPGEEKTLRVLERME